MKYFIPAWYSKGNWWSHQSTPYYNQRSISEFDEMISLMNMHIQNKVDFQTIILNYYPDLRTFLHRNDLFEMNYWSVFDEIQGFENQKLEPINFEKLHWPQGTEFVYTPFIVRCITAENKYSNVYFNQDGYVIWIESFESGLKQQRYILDDRGFLSSIQYFDLEGKVDKQEYMTINGNCILTENLKTGEVTVTENYQQLFLSISYVDMSELIQERLSAYMDKVKVDAPVIIASDERHNNFMTQALKSFKTCFSIFKNRNYTISQAQIASIEKSDYWLVDLLDNEQILQDYKAKYNISSKIMRITPFDAQVFPNISGQLYEMYVGVWIDGTSENELRKLMNHMIGYIEQNSEVRLVLLTQIQDNDIPQWLRSQIQDVNNRHNKIDEMEDVIESIPTEEYVSLIELKHVPLEIDIIETVSKLRIIIDLSKEPELFLQISSISTGIPQINKRQTDYVKNKTNGLVIEKSDEIIPAIKYFLDHLKNWNYSYAYSIKLVEAFASKNIVKQLDCFIKGDL